MPHPCASAVAVVSFCLFSGDPAYVAEQFQLLDGARVKHRADPCEFRSGRGAEAGLLASCVQGTRSNAGLWSGEKSMGCRTLTPSVLRECGTLYGEAIADAIFWPVNVQRGVWERRDGASRHKAQAIGRLSTTAPLNPPARLCGEQASERLLPT